MTLALFVGFGRLYLGVHWPSDVLAGWALGALQVVAAALWLRRADAGPRQDLSTPAGGCPRARAAAVLQRTTSPRSAPQALIR